jgi:hypothetical protein
MAENYWWQQKRNSLVEKSIIEGQIDFESLPSAKSGTGHQQVCSQQHSGVVSLFEYQNGHHCFSKIRQSVVPFCSSHTIAAAFITELVDPTDDSKV